MQSMKSGWYKYAQISTPPSFIFGLVWSFLYISYAFIWNYLISRIPKWLNFLFLANMILNLLWVVVFFGLGDIQTSKFIIVILLLITIIQLIAVYKYTKKTYEKTSNVTEKRAIFYSILVLFLYALWLAFATKLNLGISLK